MIVECGVSEGRVGDRDGGIVECVGDGGNAGEGEIVHGEVVESESA